MLRTCVQHTAVFQGPSATHDLLDGFSVFLMRLPPHHFLIHTKQVQRVSVPRQGSRTVTNRESHFNPIIGTTKDSLSVPLSRDGQINVCRRTRVPFPWSGNDRGQDGRAKQCLGNVPQWSMVQSGQ